MAYPKSIVLLWAAVCVGLAGVPALAEDAPMIIRVKDRLAYIDAGAKDGLQAGEVFDILAVDVIAHPLTGDTLAVTPKSVGTLRVHQVFDKMAVARILMLDEGTDPMLARIGRVTDTERLQKIEAMMQRQAVMPMVSGVSRGLGLVPGLYQIKTESPVKGWALLGLETASLAAAIGYRVNSNDWKDSYDSLEPGTPQSEFEFFFQKASDRRRTSNRLFWVAGALYAYNWVDILWGRKAAMHMHRTPRWQAGLSLSRQGSPMLGLRHRF